MGCELAMKGLFGCTFVLLRCSAADWAKLAAVRQPTALQPLLQTTSTKQQHPPAYLHRPLPDSQKHARVRALPAARLHPCAAVWQAASPPSAVRPLGPHLRHPLAGGVVPSQAATGRRLSRRSQFRSTVGQIGDAASARIHLDSLPPSIGGGVVLISSELSWSGIHLDSKFPLLLVDKFT
ncbi:unnamed protein product [Urochloa humidicola]